MQDTDNDPNPVQIVIIKSNNVDKGTVQNSTHQSEKVAQWLHKYDAQS